MNTQIVDDEGNVINVDLVEVEDRNTVFVVTNEYTTITTYLTVGGYSVEFLQGSIINRIPVNTLAEAVQLICMHMLGDPREVIINANFRNTYSYIFRLFSEQLNPPNPPSL